MKTLTQALVLALVSVAAIASQAPQTAPQTLRLTFKDSPTYKEGVAAPLKSVVLRRPYMKPIPDEAPRGMKVQFGRGFANVEIWMTNMDVDVCSLPNALDAQRLAYQSDSDFALVYTGGWQPQKNADYQKTPLGDTVFSDEWLSTPATAQTVFFFHEPLGGVSESTQRQLIAGDKKESALSYVTHSGSFLLFHSAAKDRMYSDINFRYVILRKTPDGLRVQFDKTRTGGGFGGKLAMTGDLAVTRVCPPAEVKPLPNGKVE